MQKRIQMMQKRIPFPFMDAQKNLSQRRRCCVQVVSGAIPSLCQWGTRGRLADFFFETPIFEIFESPTALRKGVGPFSESVVANSPRIRTMDIDCWPTDPKVLHGTCTDKRCGLSLLRQHPLHCIPLGTAVKRVWLSYF